MTLELTSFPGESGASEKDCKARTRTSATADTNPNIITVTALTVLPFSPSQSKPEPKQPESKAGLEPESNSRGADRKGHGNSYYLPPSFKSRTSFSFSLSSIRKIFNLTIALSLIPTVVPSACFESAQHFDNEADGQGLQRQKPGVDFNASAGPSKFRTRCVFESSCGQYVNNSNWKYNGTCVTCFPSPATNSTISQSILDELTSTVPRACLRKIHVLDIHCKYAMPWPTIVNFSEFNEDLTDLQSITVKGCNLTKDGLEGTISRNILKLDLSHNALDTLPNTLFPSNNSRMKLSFVVLSNNPYLKSLPSNLLNLTSIQDIWLGSNNFSCAWVAKYLFPWFHKNHKIIADAHELDCKHVDATLSIMRFTVYGILKAKHDENVECKKVFPSCACSIYSVQRTEAFPRNKFPVSFTSHGDNMSITLNVTCSSQNLTELPSISPLTRFLNVSHNRITQLDKLHSPEYANLGSLVAEHNYIRSIDSIQNTPFIKQFDVLGLSHNNITSLPSKIMAKILDNDVGGHGRVSLGYNYIECDCDTAEHVKSLLVIHQKKMEKDDAKQIFCKNFNVKVQDLEYSKVCLKEEEHQPNVLWYVIIAIEVFLIIAVLVKVWHDSRQYRLTGILPWFSAKMPRLPCDYILEGFKGPLNGRRR